MRRSPGDVERHHLVPAVAPKWVLDWVLNWIPPVVILQQDSFLLVRAGACGTMEWLFSV